MKNPAPDDRPSDAQATRPENVSIPEELAGLIRDLDFDLDHDRVLSAAFDGQAARFEKAPVQTDPDALARLVRAADLPDGSTVLDAGCGPGLVSLAFLQAGHRVVGVDLSSEMIARARARCAGFGDRARFKQGSLHEQAPGSHFDAAISRYVLHHVVERADFVRRQVELVRPGGVIVLSDHTTDPDADLAARHNSIERLRDLSHVRCLTAGGLVDLFAFVGLGSIRLVEESFSLDFDEWFDRGTPSAPKDEVRARIVGGRQARGFRGVEEADGRVTIHCWRAIIRGVTSGG